jgi:glycosyltransferase involved in cell wall biosynthesis
MKVVAVLDIPIDAGGGFNQGLTAILQMSRVCKGRFDFEVVTGIRENVTVLERLGIECDLDVESTADRLVTRLMSIPLVARIRLRFDKTWRYPIERRLLARNADIVYLVGGYSVPRRLRTLNYIYTIWDLCHRDYPEFPEVRSYGAFQVREDLYQRVLKPAQTVLTDSVQLVESIARRYGVDRERMLPMPFGPAPFVTSATATPTAEVLRKYSLDAGYLFYPAQFWAHKNHVRILEALVLLRARNQRPVVVFSGGDQGNRAHVERIVATHDLGDQIRFIGFAPTEDMRGLYDGSHAVIMPTYFGPTNIPPLEAWSLQKPVIYSAHLREQVRDAALLADADDAGQLASAIEKVRDPETCSMLIRAGTARLQELEQQRTASEQELVRRLTQFEARRRCWE